MSLKHNVEDFVVIAQLITTHNTTYHIELVDNNYLVLEGYNGKDAVTRYQNQKPDLDHYRFFPNRCRNENNKTRV